MVSAGQIKREVSIMKLVMHPNVVRLHEVLASRVKIYMVLELASGGELFDRIVRRFSCPFVVMLELPFLFKDLHILQIWA